MNQAPRRSRRPVVASLAVVFTMSAAACTTTPTADPTLGDRAVAESNARNRAQLEALWQERMDAEGFADPEIRPGDLLEISVPGLPELQAVQARVSRNGNILLPLVGRVPAAGESEYELADTLRRRISGRFLRNPSVMVFVAESRYRSVGVIGEVQSPGFYDWFSSQDTVLDAISLAGGTTADSAPRAVLIPAGVRHGRDAEAGKPPTAPLSPARAAERGDSIVIDFSDDSASQTSLYLSLPLRPGDVVVIPRLGSVLVSGWVIEPGAYPISDSATVLGAIAAAGGAHFAARRDAVTVQREIDGARRTIARLSLSRLSDGSQADLRLREGDIVEVGYSVPKVVAYFIYNAAVEVFRVGFTLF